MSDPGKSVSVSVVIVNWNSRAMLRQCLLSLEVHCRDRDYEVIVIDGASYDGCGEMLAREFPWVRFIQSDTNVGFARANNLAAAQARGCHLLFLNPDTELVEDSMQILVSRLESLPSAGAVGCRLLNSDRTLQTSCVQAFPTVWNQFIDSNFLRRLFRKSKVWGTGALEDGLKEPCVVDVIVGACLLMKRTVFGDVGGFSERYFMYAEDADLCLKLKRSGYSVYYVPETSLIHHGGSSSREAGTAFSAMMTRRSLYEFFLAHRGGGVALGYRLAMVASSVLRLALLLPARLVGRRGKGRGAFRKWYAVLSWGLGFTTWTPEKSGSKAPASADGRLAASEQPGRG